MGLFNQVILQAPAPALVYDTSMDSTGGRIGGKRLAINMGVQDAAVHSSGIIRPDILLRNEPWHQFSKGQLLIANGITIKFSNNSRFSIWLKLFSDLLVFGLEALALSLAIAVDRNVPCAVVLV